MLPKIKYPLFEFEVPSTKKKIKLRPMTAREEKILLMAKEGEDETEIFGAIKQVINNCVVSEGFDVDKAALFDLEYLFVKVRVVSVSNVTNAAYIDEEDKNQYNFDVDLNKVQVKYNKELNDIVPIDETISIKLKFPQGTLYTDKDFLHSEGEKAISKLILSCVESVIDGDKVYKVEDLSEGELQEFMDGVAISAYDKIRDFLYNLPTLFYEIVYTNSLGHERKVVLNKLTDFFTF